MKKLYKELHKLLRFVKIYGLRRTLFKAAGRKRWGTARLLMLNFRTRKRSIGIVGCGQFAFATIGAIIEMYAATRYRRCYDIDKAAQSSFAKFFGIEDSTHSIDQICNDPAIDLVYIASNHASHTSYAIDLLAAKKSVYIEKPISVNWVQFAALCSAIERARTPIYFGYNRPFSKAVTDLHSECRDVTGPVTLSFFVQGHTLGADHWYRNPTEGTRVCGNMGHWLDLAVHILSWQHLEDRWIITLLPADRAIADDNVCVVLRSLRGDLITLVLTARNEPYEGINETVNMQWGSVNATIDDFRAMTIRNCDRHKNYRYWPKDVGHKAAILQPFWAHNNRWAEVKASTTLMLEITDMVINGTEQMEFSFSEILKRCCA